MEANPVRIFSMMTAYQQTAALKAAIELGLFTAVAEGQRTPAELAAKCGATERGMRMLADYLTVHGLLEKQPQGYRLTPDSEVFLNHHSPAYMGGMIGFLGASGIRRQFDALTEAVAEEYGGWVDFAQSMEAMMGPAAQQIAALDNHGPLAVLDVAASHGMFGFSIARANPAAHITALDWANVLEVTKRNAARWGLADRVSTIAGDAFTVDLAGPYDVILLTNLLHHFDHAANVRLLKRLKAALKPGGRVVTLEFVPNADRISPPMPATFSLVMLASTPAGDAFTFAEFESMFAEAGFASSLQIPVDGTPQTLILSQ